MFEQLLDVPEGQIVGCITFRHVTTVDGHSVLLSMEYEGFEAPKGLRAEKSAPSGSAP
jgi:hypothetical protein